MTWNDTTALKEEIMLKPCPFCLSSDINIHGPDHNPAHESWAVCADCGASSGLRRTEQKVIAIWNTRAGDAKTRQLESSIITELKECGTILPIFNDEMIRISDAVLIVQKAFRGEYD